MKTTAIIQARMGSTRLFGKVMKIIQGKTVLEHVIERVKQAELIDEVIIATTVHKNDDVIAEEALRCGAKVFRGSEEDVLSRYYFAAKENDSEVIIRITSDCPLIDPVIVDKVVHMYQESKYDIVTNAGNDLSKRTYPRGLDTEVFSYRALENAYLLATEAYQREHVTPYIYEHGTTGYYVNDKNYSKYRWTLDTDEDWQLISIIYEKLYHGKHDFYLAEVLALMEQNPKLEQINQHVEQKKLK